MRLSDHLSQGAVFSHPTIGPIRCQREDDLFYFRGIQYASLRNWFDNAKLPAYDGSGLNAQEYGYEVPAVCIFNMQSSMIGYKYLHFMSTMQSPSHFGPGRR